MKKIAWVVLLVMGTLATTGAFAQDKSMKPVKTTTAPKHYGRLSGKQLTKTPVQKTTVVTSKTVSAKK